MIAFILKSKQKNKIIYKISQILILNFSKNNFYVPHKSPKFLKLNDQAKYLNLNIMKSLKVKIRVLISLDIARKSNILILVEG